MIINRLVFCVPTYVPYTLDTSLNTVSESEDEKVLAANNTNYTKIP